MLPCSLPDAGWCRAPRGLAFAASPVARGRLREFREELLALRESVDEETQATVIDPWLGAVERVGLGDEKG